MFDRSVVAGDPAVDFDFSAACRAGVVFACAVAAFRADRVGRRDREVGEFEGVSDLFDECRSRLPGRKFFAEEGVENGSARELRLKFVLDFKCFERIGRVVYRKVAAVGIERFFAVVCCSGTQSGSLATI